MNRWFDKSIQLIATENGKGGVQGEHSMMDGMPVVSLADVITRSKYRDAEAASSSYYDDVNKGVDMNDGGEGAVREIFAECAPDLVGGDSALPGMIERGEK